jgi:ferredoxin-thioredoxin reductase catalytic subunit
MAPKTAAEVDRFTAMVAAKQGWRLTADASFYADLADGLRVNWERYGYFLCPCRDTAGGRAADADIVCPCRYAAADVAEYGHCFCSLYQSPEFAASGKPAAGIADRRHAGK